jgi:hypothetical protein
MSIQSLNTHRGGPNPPNEYSVIEYSSGTHMPLRQHCLLVVVGLGGGASTSFFFAAGPTQAESSDVSSGLPCHREHATVNTPMVWFSKAGVNSEFELLVGYSHSRRSRCDQVVTAFLSAFTKKSLCYIDFR